MHKFLLQTHPCFPSEIKNYGCNFMCHAVMADKATDPQELLYFFNLAKSQKILGNNCYVNDNNTLLKLMGSKMRFTNKLPASFIRLQFKTLNPQFNHFVLTYNGQTYNPDPTLRLINCLEIRYFA